MLVYKITNMLNGMLYIGITTKTIQERWKAHLNWARFSKPYKLHEAINIYGEDNFIIEQIDSTKDFKDLKELEKKYIKLHNCIYPNGYNLTAGGQGVLGVKFSVETRKKLSDLAKGKGNSKMITKEAIEKARQSRLGKTRTEEQKILISKNRKGKGLLNDAARKHPKERVLLAMELLQQNLKQCQISNLTGLGQSYISNLKNKKRGSALLGV